MDTKPLERFATQARRDLLSSVDARATSVLAAGSVARAERPEVVRKLEAEITAHGREHVIDKVAYTWFNRIIALRFMDARGYTDAGIVSPAQGQVLGQPEILAEAKRGNLDSDVVISKDTVETILALLDGSRRSTDAEGEAYALLLTEYCRYWHKSMPFMFEREGDYTELLVPAGLLADGAILSKARDVLTEEVCDDVEVIGWLYQFYIAERKDDVFAGFKKNKKAGADEISPATQLFTPHWIVRYLVENSVGRLWMLNRPSSRLIEQMDYYIPPVDDEPEFLKIARPEDLRVIDPACGSGHILTYAFDLLYAVYEEAGHSPAEIPGLILTNNLHGTEIDPRAGALAAFALTMKARAKQRTFFGAPVGPKIRVIEPILFDPAELALLTTPELSGDDVERFWNAFASADLLGALLRPNGDLIESGKEAVRRLPHDLVTDDVVRKAEQVIHQAEYLTGSYDAVVANPPYMGAANMGLRLSEQIRREYPLEKQDLYACFVARALELIRHRGRVAMVIGDTWMTAKTSERFRQVVLEGHGFDSFLHLDDVSNHPDIFGANAAFVLSTSEESAAAKTRFVALEPLSSEDKRRQFLEAIADPNAPWVHRVSVEQLKVVPGMPLAYWLSDAKRAVFARGKRLDSLGAPKQGIKTGDNSRFLRYWWEVEPGQLGLGIASREEAADSGKRWFPCQKGGDYRRWYGNDHYVVDWYRDGAAIRNFRDANGKLRSRPQNLDWMFRPGVTWGTISSGASSFRISPAGTFSESKGAVCYVDDPLIANFLLGFLNSSVASDLLAALSPTIDYGEGSVAKLPIDERLLDGPTAELATKAVEISKQDWQSQETSLGFESNELVELYREHPAPLRDVFERWNSEAQSTTSDLADIEESINRAVAVGTGLLDEAPLRPDPTAVSLFKNSAFQFARTRSAEQRRKLALQRLAKDLVSYSVGCMFGRFELDTPGPSSTFMPDKDNTIPIIDGDWFDDDIVERFRQFVRVAFGEAHFQENVRFVADALGVRELRDYFLKSFFTDHVKRYRQCPIYWLFSSPTGSFRALIYMHKYTPSTVSTVLNEYLREFQAKLTLSLQQAVAANHAKDVDRLQAILSELDRYEHDVLYPMATRQIPIDLNDGVNVNYPKFYPAVERIGSSGATG